MHIPIILIAFGLLALFYGAEWLVKGAARLASSFGVSPLVIGLTLVAFGTSAPELLVSLIAALRGSSDLSLGNVVGSNIANIGFILGLVSLLFPIVVHSSVLWRELPMMITVSLLAYLFALDGTLGRGDGLLLVLGLLLFNLLAYRLARGAEAGGDTAVADFTEYEEAEGMVESAARRINRLLEVGRAVVGILILVVGAQSLVRGATELALAFGVSELAIGMTLVAFGTSLPELATSLVSAYRDEDDISVGNIIGSNIFNILAVLGLTASIRPISVAASVIRFDFPIMLAFSIILWPMVRHEVLERWQAALLLLGYIGFTLLQFTR